MYDITNVLEGIGLLSKENKASVKWCGSSNSEELSERLNQLRHRVEELEEEERMLDDHHLKVQQNLKSLAETLHNAQLAYVSHSDIRSVPTFAHDTLVALKAPSGARLTVPEPRVDAQVATLCYGEAGAGLAVSNQSSPFFFLQTNNYHYEIHLRSDHGPIDALLVRVLVERA